jgi:cell fate regulator YaaT (PSP1 superfamily)
MQGISRTLEPSLRPQVLSATTTNNNNKVAQHASGKSSPPSLHGVEVAGHHGRTRAVLSAISLQPGQHVVFEGDRGEDLGIVVRNVSDAPRSAPLVVRNASADEIAYWSGPLADLGDDAVRDCRELVQKLGLPLQVFSASFQLDKAKVTIFYECQQRVDFRRLLVEMFNKYRCRIWMERV